MDKREIIIMSARQLFAKYGPYKTTVEEIIRFARVAKGTFYKYFPNKDTLLLEVLEKEVGEYFAAIHASVSKADSAREKMRAYWLTGAHKMLEMENYHGVSEDTFPGIIPQLEEFAGSLFTRVHRVVVEILETGVQRGELVIDDIEKTAHTLIYTMGLDDLKDIRRFQKEKPLSVEEMIDRLVDIVFSGLEPRT